MRVTPQTPIRDLKKTFNNDFEPKAVPVTIKRKGKLNIKTSCHVATPATSSRA